MSWSHLLPMEKLHSARSNPALKASSTTHLHAERVKASDRSIRRSSEGANHQSGEPMQMLSPRPEPDSRKHTQEPSTEIPTPEPELQFLAPESGSKPSTIECYPGALILENLSERLDAADIIPAHREDKKENNSESQLPLSPSASAKELCASLKGLKVSVAAMGLRGSGTISPLSDDSINDLIQSMPDTPVAGDSPNPSYDNIRFGTSKIPRIEVSEHSMEGTLGCVQPLTDVSNATQTIPATETATSVFSGKLTGPHASTIERGFAHGLGDYFTIPEGEKSLLDNPEFLEKVRDVPKRVPGPPIANSKLQLSTLEHAPIIDGPWLKKKLPAGAPMPPLSGSAGLTKPPLDGLPPIPLVPGILIDATGHAPAPDMPAQNLPKGQRMKAKGRRFIRKGRRIVLRKPILSLVLGRQLAGPTKTKLKIISEGGSEVVIAVPITAPVPVPL